MPKKNLFPSKKVPNKQHNHKNLKTSLSKQVGKSQRVKGADYALESIHNLREAIPELWEADKIANVSYPGSGVTVETSVTA